MILLIIKLIINKIRCAEKSFLEVLPLTAYISSETREGKNHDT